MIAGVLLGAGFGRRFGGDKLVALLNGKPLIRWSAEAMLASTDALHVVIPPGAMSIREALAGLDVHLVENPFHAEGMGSSIRAGVAAVDAGATGVVIGLGDQPFVDAEVVAKLRDTFAASEAGAVVPLYQNGRGNPVLFSRSCFAALLAMGGDMGARSILDHLADVATVKIDSNIPDDVDTREALDLLASGLRA